MSTHRGKRWLIAVVATMASVLTLETALATEQVIFGPHQYTRTSGPPNQFSETIALPLTLTAPFRLHVQNGNPDGTHRLSSATITLNGTQVAGPAEFNQQVAGFDKSVTLQASNTLQLRLTSTPGGFLILTLFGTVPPPVLTKLEPPTLPITQGGTGTLTATISAAQTTDTLVSLSASPSSVLSLPSSVTVPANSLTTTITITALSPGTATITAALNGSSVSSTVTVAPAGPTLTSLLPATLQVTQGAAGTLTVTISAAQGTDTLIGLTSSNASLVSLPPSGTVTVPAGQTTQAFAVFGVGQGTATITASLNGTTAESQVTVILPLPTVVSLLPPVLPLTEGSAGTLTVTLNASQPTNTDVALATSDPTVVGLPATGGVTVPAHSLSLAFPVTGLKRGTATVTASLNGTSATSAITVQPPPPTLQGLTCPATLTEGATSLCTVALNATQLTDTVVPLASSDGAIVTVPASVTVPANALTAAFSVTAGATPGVGSITAGPLNGTSQTATIQVLPPPPTIVSLTPAAVSLYVGATANLTLTLNAAQLTDTLIPLSASPSAVLSLPSGVTVPAGSLSAPVPVQGLSPGSATLTAGPLNGTQAQSSLTVNQLPPTVSLLTPGSLTLPKGKAGILTVTIAPTQSDPTVVPLSSSDPSVEVPGSVTVPAGAAMAEFPVVARSEGSATVTAGPLNGTSQSVTITVTPAELVTLAITPPAPTIAKGQTQQFTLTGTYTDATTQDLTGTATWTSSDPTVAPITSPGGLATGLKEGQVTLTATVGSMSSLATLTVTPPILASLAISPMSPTLLLGQTLQFQAMGTLTDGSTQDVTAAVTWSSDNPSVATISAGGLAFALGTGTATITATHPDGFTASTSLTVILPPPTISSFSPSSGKAGTSVTLTGTNFVTASAVRFNGTPVSGFSVTGTTTITTAVPSSATTGPISVTTSAGTATSVGSFIVLPTQDFQLSALPATISVPSVGQGTVQVSLSGTEGFTGLMSLAVSGVPTGGTATFAASTLTVGQSTLLTLQTTGTTPANSYALNVTATGLVNGVSTTRSATLTLQVQPAGQTSLVGQVFNENAQPVQGAVVRLGSLQAITDAGGNFLLLNPPVGSNQLLLIDGTPASTAERNYPIIPYKVTIVAGQANALGFTPYLHFQKTTGFVDISNSSIQRVVTDPSLPGYQMTIPAGVSITGWDGQPNSQISVRKVPIDRSPLPPIPAGLYAPSLYMDYFGKPGGGTPSAPIPIILPNDLGVPPGTQVEFWFYDEAPDGSRPNVWAKYGTGTVSPDGSQIVPDIDPSTGKPYGQPRFCCGALVLAISANIQGQQQGRSTAAQGTGVRGGEPVDLATGIFVLEKTDMVLPGRFPVAFTRTYRTQGPTAGPFGPGTSHSYNVMLLFEGGPMTLLLPNGGRIPFTLQPDGTYKNMTGPAFLGTVLTTAEGYALRFKDGTRWTFGQFGGAASPFFPNVAFLASQTDRNGSTITLTRTGQFNEYLSTITDAAGRRLQLTYDGSYRITSITDPLGRTVGYTYNAAGYLETVTDPAGGVTRYTYDVNGQMLTLADARGITFLTNAYDLQARVSRQTQADGGQWQFAYTTVAGVITQTVLTDPRGNPTTYRFNGQGYPLSITDALGQTTTFTRDPSTNLLLATTDPLGRTTRFTYDAAGNVTRVTDPLSNVRTFTYEPTFNRVTSITDPLGNVSRFEYDPANGNLLKITDALGSVTQIAYNQFGQPLTTTNPLGNITAFAYDAQGNLATIADSLGNTTQRSYDLASRLATQRDPLGRVTQFGYDNLNRITEIADALNQVTRFSYDPNGNLLTVTDAHGNSITHEYDPMDRLSRRINQLGAAETFSYDANGNLVTAMDRKNQTSTFTYDPLNRRTQATYADGAVATFTYDAAGRLVQADDTADPHRPITMTYDTLDRLLAETTALGTVGYTYDALGRRTSMTVSGQPAVSYAYDANSRLRTITQVPLNPVDIQYDALNRRTLLVLPNGVSTEYQFDAASRLTALIYRNALGTLGDLQYTYDPAGNRVAVGGSFARTLVPDVVPSAGYDTANRQLTFGDKSMTFDANGNLASLTAAAGTTTYTWDARNRLVGIGGPSLGASFAYDGFGRRAVKTIDEQSTSFLYDGLDIVREAGGTGDASYLRTLGIDETVARTGGVDTVYFLADALGSTVALTSAAGSPTTTYTYEPYGQASFDGSAASLFQYAGRENDGTGLYYYRARYYHATLHRFLSEDMWGIAGNEANFYRYVGNNPTTFVDPLGWWKTRWHEQVTREKMRQVGGFGEQDLNIAAQANREMDTRDPVSWIDPWDPNHYMPRSNTAKADWIIQDKFREAVARNRAGDRPGAMRSLGEALHTLQDASAHAEANPPGGMWRHVVGLLPLIPHADNPADNPAGWERAQRDTECLLRDFKAGARGRKCR